MTEIKTISRDYLKQKFPTKKRMQLRFKPFENKSCLVCGTSFGKKPKVEKDYLGTKYVECKSCGLKHFNSQKYPEILLVCRQDEEELRGKFKFQEETCLYMSDEELKDHNEALTKTSKEVDELKEQILDEEQKMLMENLITLNEENVQKTGIMTSKFGSTPIYYGYRK